MEFLDSILSPQIIAPILIIAAFAMSIRFVLQFTREATTLRPRLTQVESELTRLHQSMANRKKAVDDLAQQVVPIKEQESKMRLYYEQLQDLKIQEEKKEQELAEQQRIQPKKRGFDL